MDDDDTAEMAHASTNEARSCGSKHQRVPVSAPSPDGTVTRTRKADQVMLPGNRGCIVNVRVLHLHLTSAYACLLALWHVSSATNWSRRQVMLCVCQSIAGFSTCFSLLQLQMRMCLFQHHDFSAVLHAKNCASCCTDCACSAL